MIGPRRLAGTRHRYRPLTALITTLLGPNTTSYSALSAPVRSAVVTASASSSEAALNDHRHEFWLDTPHSPEHAFIVQWQLPDVTHGRMADDGGQPAVFLLARDGSRVEAATTPTACGYPVRQYGPQRLWTVRARIASASATIFTRSG